MRSVLTQPRMLPSNGEQVAQYNKKVFCGTHARNGDIFITACPDKIRLYDTRRERFKLIQTIEVQKHLKPIEDELDLFSPEMWGGQF